MVVEFEIVRWKFNLCDFNKTFFTFVASLIFSFCFCCIADDPPVFVWRADSRPPDVIFQQGFSSYGTDMDYVQHVVGESSLTERSAFISTTKDQSMAYDWAIYGLLHHQPRPLHYCIYQIRATDNFLAHRSLFTGKPYYAFSDWPTTCRCLFFISG